MGAGANLCIVLVLLGIPAAAAQGPLSVLEDLPVALWNEPLEPARAWTGAVRVRASEDVTVSFLSTDLIAADGARIGREQVVVLGDRELLADGERDFRIEVRGVPRDGTYDGTVTIIAQNGTATTRFEVPIRLEAILRPSLSGVEALDLQAVRCPVRCWFAGTIAPSDVLVERDLIVRNDGPGIARVAGAEITLVSTHPSRQVVRNPEIPAMLVIEQNRTIAVPVIFGDLEAGHYEGNLTLRLEGGASTSIPIALDVRVGPVWAFAWILAGVLAAQFLDHVRTKVLPRQTALRKVRLLFEDVTRLDTDIAGAILPLVLDLEDRVLHNQLEDVDADVATQRGRLEILQFLQVVRYRAAAAENDEALTQLNQAIVDAHGARTDEDWNGVHGLVRTASETLDEREDASKFATAMSPGATLPAPRAPRAPLSRIIGRMRRDRGMRFLAFVIITLVVTFIGLIEVYGADPTFGDDRLADYSSLLFWGFIGKVAADGLRDKLLGPIP